MARRELRTDDGKVHLFRTEGEKYRAVTSEVNWASYDGKMLGYRYSEMDQINTSNVGRLGAGVVVQFLLYEPAPNHPPWSWTA